MTEPLPPYPLPPECRVPASEVGAASEYARFLRWQEHYRRSWAQWEEDWLRAHDDVDTRLWAPPDVTPKLCPKCGQHEVK